jgi:hypothetical protein
MRLLPFALCLSAFILGAPAYSGECALIGKDACVRAAGADCQCPAVQPATDRDDIFKRCVESCCAVSGPGGCGAPTSLKSQICDCTCSDGIPHVIGEKVFCE